MKRHPAFCEHPRDITEVCTIDDKRIAFPTADGIASVGRRYVITMSATIHGNDLECMIGLVEHHDEFRSLNNLSDTSDTEQTDVQSAKRSRNAAQGRIILVAETLRFLLCPWL